MRGPIRSALDGVGLAAVAGFAGLDWRDNVVSDPSLVRPLESGRTLANPAKAKRVLSWEPTVSFEDMIRRMVAAQVANLRSLDF